MLHYVLILSASAMVIGYGISLLIPFDLVWVMVGLVSFLSLFLIGYSLRKLMWHYALVAMFALMALCFLVSVVYVFNQVLEPHQQRRIKVILGLEDEPPGAGYNVNQ